MDPFTIAAIMAGGKAAFGAAQYLKGRNLARQNQRPTYEIPSAVNEQLRLAKAQAANTRMPGQSQLEENLQGGVQSGLRAAKEYGDPVAAMATISALNANQNQAYQNIATQGAEFQQKNIANLENRLGDYAQFQDQAFQYNKDEPYRIKAAAAQALKGAGIQNIQSGISDLGGSYMKKMGGTGSAEGGANTQMGLSQQKTLLQQAGYDTANMSPEQIMSAFKLIAGTIG